MHAAVAASLDGQLGAGMSTVQMLALQRTIGNQAVGQMLSQQAGRRRAAREPAPAAAPEKPAAAPAAPVAEAAPQPAGAGAGAGGAPPLDAGVAAGAPAAAGPGAAAAGALPAVGSGGAGGAAAPEAATGGPLGAPGTLPKSAPPSAAPGGSGAGPAATTPAKALAPGATPSGAGAPEGLTRQPTPLAPTTDTDWGAWWRTSDPAMIRMALEVARLYPGYGAIAGAASDVMTGTMDIATINNEDAPVIKTIIIVRSIVNLINNAFGHLAYCNQLVEDGATVSVFGAVLTPFNAGANELIKLEKVVLDVIQESLDISLVCAAKQKLTTAKPPSKSADAWQSMVNGYEANIVGGFVGGILDAVDLASGGFSNGEPIKQGVHVVSAILTNGARFEATVGSFLRGLFDVVGGTLFGNAKKGLGGGGGGAGPAGAALIGGAPAAPGLARVGEGAAAGGGGAGALPRRVAAAMMLEELHAIKGAYVAGDELLDVAARLNEQQMAQLSEVFKTVSGGKDPFVFARDSVVAGLHHLEDEITRLTEVSVVASTAQEKTQAVHGVVDPALAQLDKLRLPAPPPKPETTALDVAKAVVNPVGALAGLAADALVDKVRGTVDETREGIRAPLLSVKNSATEIGEFMQILTTEAKSQAEWAREKVAKTSAALAKCHNVEDVFNALIAQVMEMMGISGSLKIEDFRQGWKDLGVEIDGAIVFAEGVSRGGDDAAPAALGRSPQFVGGPAGADEDEDET